MSKTDTLLVSALRQAVIDDFGFVPTEDDIEYVFSDRFVKNLNKIYLPDEKPFRFFLYKNRIALLVMTILILLFSFGCAIPEIREDIRDYFVEVYNDSFVIFWKESVIAENIKDYYLPAVLPDGFITVDTKTDEFGLSALFEKNSGQGRTEKIEFYQQLIPENGVKLWNEHSTIKNIQMNGLSCEVYSSADKMIVIYQYDGYVFKIRCSESIPIEDIVSMLESLDKANADY